MSRYWEKRGEMGIVAVRKDVTLLGEEWGNRYSGGTTRCHVTGRRVGKWVQWRYVKMSRYWEKSGEMGIVAVRKDVTLLGEEWGNGYSGGT